MSPVKSILRGYSSDTLSQTVANKPCGHTWLARTMSAPVCDEARQRKRIRGSDVHALRTASFNFASLQPDTARRREHVSPVLHEQLTRGQQVNLTGS